MLDHFPSCQLGGIALGLLLLLILRGHIDLILNLSNTKKRTGKGAGEGVRHGMIHISR
jgi:hypothetical protein